MNIEQIKERKKEVENEILEILTKLEKETLLNTDNINMYRKLCPGGDGTVIDRIKINLKLDL